MFPLLEKFIEGVTDLKEPLKRLISNSEGSLDPAGFEIKLTGLVNTVVSSIGEKIVKNMKEKGIYNDLFEIVDIIIEKKFTDQVHEFLGESSLVSYIMKTVKNMMDFVRNDFLIDTKDPEEKKTTYPKH